MSIKRPPVEAPAVDPHDDGLGLVAGRHARRPHVEVQAVLRHLRVGVPDVGAEELLRAVFRVKHPVHGLLKSESKF